MWCRRPVCTTRARIGPPHQTPRLPVASCRCGCASSHTGRGGRAGGGGHGCTHLPSPFYSVQTWLSSSTAAASGWRPRVCHVHLGTSQGSTDGALPGAGGCLKSRACGVAAVAMEQQDKKQVSLVATLSIGLCTTRRALFTEQIWPLWFAPPKEPVTLGFFTLFVALFVDDCTYCLYQRVRGSVRRYFFLLCLWPPNTVGDNIVLEP